MKVRYAFEALLAAGLVAAAACGGNGNGTGPEPEPVIEGTYQLATYDGTAVATMIGQSGGCDQWITGGTLTLRADRTHTRTELEEDRNCDDPANNETRTVTTTGTWLAVGQSVTLEEGMGVGGVSAEGTWDGDDTLSFTFTQSTLGGDIEIDRTFER